MSDMSSNKRLLLVGIPGMGKTTLGDYLRDRYRYVHVDMETVDSIEKCEADADAFIRALLREQGDIVVTWGFVPDEKSIAIVKKLGDLDFKKIWFDGNRESARREFIRRDSQYGAKYLSRQLDALELQLKRIEDSNVAERIQPKFVNSFDDNGAFRNVEEILLEIENI